MKKVFIISIRYTLLSPDIAQSFLSIKNKEYATFKQEMLNEDRVNLRFFLFKKFALPSLVRAYQEFKLNKGSDDVFKVIINSTELLSSHHKERLRSLAREHDFLEVVFSSEDEANIRQLTLDFMRRFQSENDVIFCTMRMDDDDAISDKFMKKMLSYTRPEFDGFGVSFPYGYICYLNKESNIIGFRHYNKPKIAIGLAYIHHYGIQSGKKLKSIYCLGAHGRIDQKVPTILDSSFKAYLRSAHCYSDVYSDVCRFNKEIEMISHEIAHDDVKSDFNWL